MHGTQYWRESTAKDSGHWYFEIVLVAISETNTLHMNSRSPRQNGEVP